MNRGSTASGYRPYALPECLPTLENAAAGDRTPDCRLVAADSDTLVWAQRIEPQTPAVLKMYRHRGVISWQREKVFRFRVQREFDALGCLDAHGIPCSKPLFWSYGRNAEFGRYEILATREVENTIRLDRFCQANDTRIAGDALLKAYEIVRLMHRNGCHHGALYPKNILVASRDSGAEPAVHIIDMPRAILFPYDITGTRMAWIDLYCLTRQIVDISGPDTCVALLERYGLEKDVARRFVFRLKDHFLPKLARNIFRAECELWELLAHIGVQSGKSSRPR